MFIIYNILVYKKIGIMNIVKIGLIGLGGYIAYNYMQKRKNNKAAEKLALSTAAVSPILIDAELQEEGEEGMALATANDSEIAEMSNANGWDSDTITSGI